MSALRLEKGLEQGGNFPMIVDTLVFDESQITSKFNYSHPTWGGQCHPLTREAGRAIIIIRTAEDELSEGDRLFKPRGASR